MYFSQSIIEIEEELEANHSQCRDAHSQLAKSVNVQKGKTLELVQPKADVRDQCTCRQHVNNGKAVLMKIQRFEEIQAERQNDRQTE